MPTRRKMKRRWPIAWPLAFRTLALPKRFERLVRHALKKHRINVMFMTRAERAVFVTPTDGRDPFIAFSHQFTADEDRACVHFAHELGHHESWLRGDTTDEYEHLMTWRPHVLYEDPELLSRELREQAYAEEERAWKYGREILTSVLPDFDRFDLYDQCAAENLKTYFDGLLLDRTGHRSRMTIEL